MRRIVLAIAAVNFVLLVVLLVCGMTRPSVAGWVEGRVAAVDMKPAERAWEQIGWVEDMPRAIALAREHKRPLFIYAMLGDLDGRC